MTHRTAVISSRAGGALLTRSGAAPAPAHFEITFTISDNTVADRSIPVHGRLAAPRTLPLWSVDGRADRADWWPTGAGRLAPYRRTTAGEAACEMKMVGFPVPSAGTCQISLVTSEPSRGIA